MLHCSYIQTQPVASKSWYRAGNSPLRKAVETWADRTCRIDHVDSEGETLGLKALKPCETYQPDEPKHEKVGPHGPKIGTDPYHVKPPCTGLCPKVAWFMHLKGLYDRLAPGL